MATPVGRPLSQYDLPDFTISNDREHGHGLSRPTTYSAQSSGHVAFPEPQLYRSVSQQGAGRSFGTAGNEMRRHRPSHSEAYVNTVNTPTSISRNESTASFLSADSFNDYDSISGDSYEEPAYSYDAHEPSVYDRSVDSLSQDLADVSLDSEEGLRRFQSHELAGPEEEWHRLVPEAAREALGNDEVQRQSVLFEIIKSERDYVSDLEAVRDVYIEPLSAANPPIIKPELLKGFISQVFGNVAQILAHHQLMLAALFARQREQHPLIQSGTFRTAYETYIKHYPLAEAHHRKELNRNPDYRHFIQSAASDPRIRKRDLVTFLSRPVTRLPRLNLLIEQLHKLTEHAYDHPDLDTLPTISGILKDFIKSTQPGIEAAESKVKFWALCESLVYRKGEIIDLDLYNDNRTLVYAGPASRRNRQDATFSGWTDLYVALLDHYFFLTREEKRPNGSIKHYMVSRPIPLAYLRLGSFNGATESRRIREEKGGLLDGLRSRTEILYPFTVYHASNKMNRRYTLYVGSEAVRRKWYAAFVDTLAVYKARAEGNMFFSPQKLSEGFFRIAAPGGALTMGRLTGGATSAAPFDANGRKYLAISCPSGVYVGHRGREDFRRVLPFNSASIAAISRLNGKSFNRFVILHDGMLFSYALDILARVAFGEATAEVLDASLQRIAGQDSSTVLFFRIVVVGSRTLLLYAAKKLLQVSLTLHVLEVIDSPEAVLSPRRTGGSKHPSSFRRFGEPGYVPKDAHDVTALTKTVGICTTDGIVIVNPTNLANSSATVVPDFSNHSTDLAMGLLKTKVEDARPLGLVPCGSSELLVVYDTLGCYITRHGEPARKSGFIRWETPATSFAARGEHVLLFSHNFIEVRNKGTGKLVQTIEGAGMRMLYAPSVGEKEPILVAMRGDRKASDSMDDKIVELVETAELSASTTSPPPSAAMWEDWDL
ncbi:uncharacterized protein SCHCODRAFT_02501635 [Schizophyllum commune H4-8]|uniref:DH domain-containing protein n=1 Tax=Schizophyllum commune (strain H4-8 / FGSC 9210) TaxID=578458 RepID=D8Q495_SCHCM|nr:uncharacterized protein SCHCODRAFT_02501635 [Schizophyllum commune H4-8]KAI5892712.1 hypothetical protein SCHCODRAFT_02501635 [Schizophyllum commune H4-8]